MKDFLVPRVRLLKGETNPSGRAGGVSAAGAVGTFSWGSGSPSATFLGLEPASGIAPLCPSRALGGVLVCVH